MITLTEAELKFLNERLIARFRGLVEAKGAESSAIDPTEVDLVNTLDAALTGLQAGQPVAIKRRERRWLQNLLTGSKNVLEKITIPGYTRRMITPARRAQYAFAKQRAMNKRDVIASILNKLDTYKADAENMKG